jgi:sialic acid synthase SpsE
MESKIIAEAATGHGGDVKVAQELISSAASIGAQVVKFQLINPESMYIKNIKTETGEFIPFAPYSTRSLEQISVENWRYLYQYSKLLGIEFAFTFFDIESLKILEDISVPFIKIASGDLTHRTLLNEVGKLGLPVILSTGMSNEKEINQALNWLNQSNTTIMHCVSLYPCPLNLAQISRVETLKKFGFPVGFSDHTLGSTASILAHNLGSRVFEKHFRLNNSPKTADYDHSLPPEEFTKYIKAINFADQVKNQNWISHSADSLHDLETKNRARRSYYFSKQLRAGAEVQLSDIKFVRPFSISGVAEFENIIGKKLSIEVFADDLISWDVLN